MSHIKKITVLLISMLVLTNTQLHAGRDKFISTPRMIAGLTGAAIASACLIGILFGYIIRLHRKIAELENRPQPQPDLSHFVTRQFVEEQISQSQQAAEGLIKQLSEGPISELREPVRQLAVISEVVATKEDVRQQIQELAENAGTRLIVDYLGTSLSLQDVLALMAQRIELEEQEKRLNAKLERELNSFQILKAATEQQAREKEAQAQALEQLRTHCRQLTATQSELNKSVRLLREGGAQQRDTK